MGLADDQGGGGLPFWKVGSMEPTTGESRGLFPADVTAVAPGFLQVPTVWARTRVGSLGS